MQPLNGADAVVENRPGQDLKTVQYCRAISEAFVKNHVQPFSDELDRERLRSNWDTWLDVLKSFRDNNLQRHQEYLIPCYLFAVSIGDPAKKEGLFSDCLKELSEKERRNFYYHICESLPAVMSVHILRYCPKADWEGVFQSLFKFDHMYPSERMLFTLMQQVTKAAWSLEEKQQFLDTLFERLPSKKGDGLIYYFVVKADNEHYAAFLSVCSTALHARFTGLLATVREFGEKTLAELAVAPKKIRLPYDEGHQRHYFLSWFYSNAKDHPAAALIALDFREKDWQWLADHVNAQPVRGNGPHLTAYAMKWLLVVIQRLKDGTLQPEPWIHGGDIGYWLFISNCTDFITKNSRPNEISEESYKQLARAVEPEILFRHHDAFKGEFRNKIVKEIVATESDKIIAWMKLIMQRSDDLRTVASEKLADVFGLVVAQNGLEELLNKIFSGKNSALFTLTVFAAVSNDARKLIVKILLAEKNEGLRCLSEWIGLCEIGKSQVRPFVRDAMLENLYKLLNAVDPNIALEVKNQLTATFQDSREALDFIDLLLPVGVDINDPVTRSNEALKKLKRHFETPNIPHRDREKFVRGIYKELRRDLSREAFMESLFHTLNPESWPLVFLYFEHDLCEGVYMEYFEEKSGGGDFQSTDKKAPAKMGENALADEHRWIAVATQSLHQMVDNPCLQHENDDSQAAWAMQRLYKAACETNTMHKIMQRLIEICPPEKFIPLITRFAQAAFYYNREGLLKLVSESLDEANVEKSQFIASCVVAESSRFQSIRGIVDLEDAFWKEPFVKTDEARALVAREIVHKMQDSFLFLFRRYRASSLPIIQSLFRTDKAFCEELFKKCVNQLVAVELLPSSKFCILQNLCDTYVRAGFDAIHLLLQEEYQELRKEIGTWYTEENIIAHVETSAISWRLLRLFAPVRLYPVALGKFLTELTSDSFINFYGIYSFLEVFQQIDCLESLTTRIFADQPLVAAFKAQIEKHVDKAFGLSCYGHLVLIVQKLVPDWCTRLSDFVKEQIKKDKEEALSYGAKPRYYSLKDLFSALGGLQLLEEFKKELLNEASDELQKDVERIQKLAFEKKE